MNVSSELALLCPQAVEQNRLRSSPSSMRLCNFSFAFFHLFFNLNTQLWEMIDKSDQ